MGPHTGALEALLLEAQGRGLLGPGPVGPHVAHARAWSSCLPPDVEFLDLGSGAGVPGLVLAMAGRPGVLVDAGARRCRWLEEAVARLGLPGVAVVEGRAEVLGRAPELRERFALVVARGFGPPAVTAECATGFLAVGGLLSVSEPPAPAPRWSEPGLASLGLMWEGLSEPAPGVRLARLRKVTRAEDRWPRRDGVPRRRPLWRAGDVPRGTEPPP